MVQNQAEESISWENFRNKLNETWEELKDVEFEDVQEDLSELSRTIHEKTGEARDEVRERIQKLAKKFNYPFE